jgi:single-strand DNA-binding protein
MQQYLGKVKPVFIEGRLKLDQWQDKDGGNRSKLKVVIESFEFIDTRGGGQGSGAGQGGGEFANASTPPPARGAGAAKQPAYTGPTHEPLGEDDIPF